MISGPAVFDLLDKFNEARKKDADAGLIPAVGSKVRVLSAFRDEHKKMIVGCVGVVEHYYMTGAIGAVNFKSKVKIGAQYIFPVTDWEQVPPETPIGSATRASWKRNRPKPPRISLPPEIKGKPKLPEGYLYRTSRDPRPRISLTEGMRYGSSAMTWRCSDCGRASFEGSLSVPTSGAWRVDISMGDVMLEKEAVERLRYGNGSPRWAHKKRCRYHVRLRKDRLYLVT